MSVEQHNQPPILTSLWKAFGAKYIWKFLRTVDLPDSAWPRVDMKEPDSSRQKGNKRT